MNQIIDESVERTVKQIFGFGYKVKSVTKSHIVIVFQGVFDKDHIDQAYRIGWVFRSVTGVPRDENNYANQIEIVFRRFD